MVGRSEVSCYNAGMSDEFEFDPETYRALMDEEIADYESLQANAAAALIDRPINRFLDLGVGTGETTLRVLESHPEATVVGVDNNEAMLGRARTRLPASARLTTGDLRDPLPRGPFDAVVSTLAVHHLDGARKANLFARVASLLRPGGRFVLADIVVPDDPADVYTEIDGDFDTPSRCEDQLAWLSAAGLLPNVVWQYRDLAVVTADAEG